MRVKENVNENKNTSEFRKCGRKALNLKENVIEKVKQKGFEKRRKKNKIISLSVTS